jgi:hypothetical protein
LARRRNAYFAQDEAPNRFAFNKTRTKLYVPMSDSNVNVCHYKSGKLITTLVGSSGSVIIDAAMVPTPRTSAFGGSAGGRTRIIL